MQTIGREAGLTGVHSRADHKALACTPIRDSTSQLHVRPWLSSYRDFNQPRKRRKHHFRNHRRPRRWRGTSSPLLHIISASQFGSTKDIPRTIRLAHSIVDAANPKSTFLIARSLQGLAPCGHALYHCISVEEYIPLFSNTPTVCLEPKKVSTIS